MVIDKLIEGIIKKKSPVIVGLDPRINMIPEDIKKRNFKIHGETLMGVAESILEFNKGIIDAIDSLVPAVKPQIAFYEQYGLEGLRAYKETCEYAKSKGLFIIADVKRGDIGSTSKAYSNAFLGSVDINGKKVKTFDVDSITVNPYLGDDCMDEFAKDIVENDRAMFVLVKTSNKTSEQIQNLKSDGAFVYEKVANIVENRSKNLTGRYGYSPIGSVVGATFPKEAEQLRRLMPTSYFLVPGYGAQGGTADDVINSFNDDGLGAIVNSSRGIIFSYLKTGLDYKTSAKEAVIKMRDSINAALENADKRYWK